MLDQIRNVKKALRNQSYILEKSYRISFNDSDEYVFQLYLITRKNNRRVQCGFQRFLSPSVREPSRDAS